MVRSAMAEYQYYQSVRTLEPSIWQQLGSPRFLKVPFVFVSSKGAALLKDISNESVKEYARKHRLAGIQFLSYVVIVIVSSTIYFKIGI